MIMHIMLPIKASQRLVYLLIGFLCFLFLGVALYLQHVGWNGVLYPPCPLCILQRIGFLGVGLFCIIGSIVTPLKKVSYGLAGLFTVGGLSAAIRQLWVIAYPKASCGLDPLETFINQFQIVQQLPFFFQADGLCSTTLPPILGLSIPIWSLLGFISFGLLFITLFFKSMRQITLKKTLSNHP